MVCNIIRDVIMNHLLQDKLLSSKKNGFITSRSILLCFNYQQMDRNSGSVDIIYYDCMWVFDTVPHRRLLSKLKTNGIDGTFLNWICFFLIGCVHEYSHCECVHSVSACCWSKSHSSRWNHLRCANVWFGIFCARTALHKLIPQMLIGFRSGEHASHPITSTWFCLKWPVVILAVCGQAFRCGWTTGTNISSNHTLTHLRWFLQEQWDRLPQANLPQANLPQANLPQAYMPQANLPQANLL